jgi:uncharacterized tellurite resistance protein B-like protein
MPYIIRNHSGQEMVDRLDRLIKQFKKHHYEFITYKTFTDRVKKKLAEEGKES